MMMSLTFLHRAAGGRPVADGSQAGPSHAAGCYRRKDRAHVDEVDLAREELQPRAPS